MKKSSFPFKSIIPLTAGSITIANFILGLIYSIKPSGNYLINALTAFPIAIRILFSVILCLVSSMTYAKVVMKNHNSQNDMASKMSLLSISTAIFAWIVVFNLKIVLNIPIEKLEISTPILVIGIIAISMFSSVKINYNFKEIYVASGSTDKPSSMTADFYPSDYYYTPKYIRSIRIISFYLIAILCALLM